MVLAGLDLQTIHIERPVLKTERGGQVPDWSLPPAEINDVPGCSVQPASGGDDRDQRDGLSAVFTVWAPMGTDIGAFDKVQVPNNVDPLMLTGQPQPWISPDLGLAHVVINLSVWRG